MLNICNLNFYYSHTTFRRLITALLVSLFLLFKFNTVNAQFINFSAEPLTNIGLVYNKEEHFETERLINRAFRLSINGSSRRDIQVSVKCIPTLNYAFERINSNIYSIQLNTANTSVSNNYYKKYKLSSIDQNILVHKTRAINYGIYDYDLLVDPVGYDYEPGQYYYSIIFTVTQP